MTVVAALGMRAVTVELPVYGARTRSLRKAFVHRGTGGLVGADGATLTVRALDDVSLAFGDGDRVGVVGANGAGKTTLLRVLAGVYEPTAGEVWAAGRIGSLLDVTLGFDEEATGRENIVTCGLLAGLSLAEVRERAGEIGAFTGLGDYLGMPVRTYSTGMRFRLGFAVCTSFEPDIVLMDEWIAVGDRSFLDKAYRRLEAFADGAGVVVLVSQDLEMLRRVCSTAVLLDAGRVRASGALEEVLTVAESLPPAARGRDATEAATTAETAGGERSR